MFEEEVDQCHQTKTGFIDRERERESERGRERKNECEKEKKKKEREREGEKERKREREEREKERRRKGEILKSPLSIVQIINNLHVFKLFLFLSSLFPSFLLPRAGEASKGQNNIRDELDQQITLGFYF